ncbi:MAG: tyrosine protein kinase, partial [Massilibacteroides sp.]|nr:tyrosine protein kinase [Massilibacteroides sp.]
MSTKEKETIGLRPIIIYYLLHWKLFVITFLCTLLPAVMYLVFYPHTYEFASRFKIHVDDQMSGSNAGGL